MKIYSLTHHVEHELIEQISFEDLYKTKGVVLFNERLDLRYPFSDVDFAFYGKLDQEMPFEELNHYSFFFSDEENIEDVIEEIEKFNNRYSVTSSSNEDSETELNFLAEKRSEIFDLEQDLEKQRELLKEVKDLRQYVIRLLEVRSIEELIQQTEKLRFLRIKGIKVSLVHSTQELNTLYSRSDAKRIEENQMLGFQKNYEGDLRNVMANVFGRPTLKYFNIFSEEVVEGKFYAVFESQEIINQDDYFLSMLCKLLFTNFIRIIQSEVVVRDTTLISQSFKQINAKAALITKDYKIRYSSDLNGLDKTCFHHLFRKTQPCQGCPLQKEESGFFEINEESYMVNSSFISTNGQKFAFHIYETAEESRRRESIKVQRGKLKSLGVVTQSLTHELNNPLGGIYELSKEISIDKEGQLKEDFEEIAKASKRCLEIIKNLQSFSSKKIKFSRINLSQTIEKAMTFTKVLGRDVNKKMDLDESIWISGSDTLLQQVVFNLFKNSVEAIKGKGDISILLYRENKRAVFEIRDSGPGFPPEMSSIALFGTKKKKQGTGLGLFLVKEFIKLHQGDLDFGNRDEGGSYFKLIFNCSD